MRAVLRDAQAPGERVSKPLKLAGKARLRVAHAVECREDSQLLLAGEKYLFPASLERAVDEVRDVVAERIVGNALTTKRVQHRPCVALVERERHVVDDEWDAGHDA